MIVAVAGKVTVCAPLGVNVPPLPPSLSVIAVVPVPSSPIIKAVDGTPIVQVEGPARVVAVIDLAPEPNAERVTGEDAPPEKPTEPEPAAETVIADEEPPEKEAEPVPTAEIVTADELPPELLPVPEPTAEIVTDEDAPPE